MGKDSSIECLILFKINHEIASVTFTAGWKPFKKTKRKVFHKYQKKLNLVRMEWGLGIPLRNLTQRAVAPCVVKTNLHAARPMESLLLVVWGIGIPPKKLIQCTHRRVIGT